MKNIFKHGGLVRFGHFENNPNQTENGSIYYNNNINLFKVYENGSWENLATRKYADSIAGGFDPKQSVKCATTEEISFSMLSLIDMHPLQEGDRVLVKDQTNQSENGIYVYSAFDGSLSRAADFNEVIEVNGGEFVFVEGGSTWATTAWVVVSHPTLIGTDAIVWSQVQGQAKNLNQAYTVGNVITTSSAIGPVTIEGTQKLLVTAEGGLDVGSGMFLVTNEGEMAASAGLITTASGLLSSVELSVGSGHLTVDALGDLTHIRGVSYHFPTAQASFSNAALTNDSSGNLSWAALTIKGLSDVSLTGGSASTGQLLRFNGSSWVNESPMATSSSNAVVKTNSSGFIDQSFLQYDINFGGEADLSGIKTLDLASGLLTSTSDGNLSKIRGVSYLFPTTQASSANAVLINDGSGTLSWGQNKLSALSDVVLTSASAKDLLRYNGSSWVNEKAVSTQASASSNSIIMTNASGYLDDTFLKYHINFGNHLLSGITDPSSPQDAATKAYVDLMTSSLTLQDIYDQDTDGSGALIITNSSDGDLIIGGDQALLISASEGLKLAADGDPTKYVQMVYKDSLLLTANTTAILQDLCFNKVTHGGLQATYRIEDTLTSGVRVGMLFVATDGSEASLADSFTETLDLDVLWSAAISGNTVQVSYTTTSGNKIMNTKLELIPT